MRIGEARVALRRGKIELARLVRIYVYECEIYVYKSEICVSKLGAM